MRPFHRSQRRRHLLLARWYTAALRPMSYWRIKSAAALSLASFVSCGGKASESGEFSGEPPAPAPPVEPEACGARASSFRAEGSIGEVRVETLCTIGRGGGTRDDGGGWAAWAFEQGSHSPSGWILALSDGPQVQAGQAITGSALILLPPGPPFDGQVFTATVTSTRPVSPYAIFSMPMTVTDLRKVGACPGASVGGSVELCVRDFYCPEPVQIDGAISGVGLRGRFDEVGASGSEDELVQYFGDGGVFAIALRQPEGATQGLLAFPESSSYDEILCLSGAPLSPPNSSIGQVSFDTVGVAGTMPGQPVAGSFTLGAE